MHQNRISAPIFHGRNLTPAQEAEIDTLIETCDAIMQRRRARVLAEIDEGAAALRAMLNGEAHSRYRGECFCDSRRHHDSDCPVRS